MQTRKVYNVSQRTTVFGINIEVNRLADELTNFSVESITYDGSGGMALFYSYTVQEEDSWEYDDARVHQRHSNNYSWD